jgi:hypothetical protein
MARFRFKCPEHGEFFKSLGRREKEWPCPECGKNTPNQIGVGTVQIMERLDNGLMGRAIERLHNVEEILNDLSDKDQIPQDTEDEDS